MYACVYIKHESLGVIIACGLYCCMYQTLIWSVAARADHCWETVLWSATLCYVRHCVFFIATSQSKEIEMEYHYIKYSFAGVCVCV